MHTNDLHEFSFFRRLALEDVGYHKMTVGQNDLFEKNIFLISVYIIIYVGKINKAIGFLKKDVRRQNAWLVI